MWWSGIWIGITVTVYGFLSWTGYGSGSYNDPPTDCHIGGAYVPCPVFDVDES